MMIAVQYLREGDLVDMNPVVRDSWQCYDPRTYLELNQITKAEYATVERVEIDVQGNVMLDTNQMVIALDLGYMVDLIGDDIRGTVPAMEGNHNE